MSRYIPDLSVDKLDVSQMSFDGTNILDYLSSSDNFNEASQLNSSDLAKIKSMQTVSVGAPVTFGSITGTTLSTSSTSAFGDNISIDKNAAVSGASYSMIDIMRGGYGMRIEAGVSQGQGSLWNISNKNGGTLTSMISCSPSFQITYGITTDSTSVSTGSVLFSGGVAVAKNIFCSGNVIASTSPSSDNHLVNRGYINSVTSTAGVGLSKVGTVFSVNTSQILQSIVAPASNFISLKPNSSNSSEFLMTTTNLIIRKNDGVNLVYIDLVSTGNIIIDSAITSSSTIQGVTATEFTQLGNINATTISASSWANVGNMNQNVSSTSTPSFTSVSGNLIGGTVSGTTGTFSGVTNVTNTTDSSSTTTGAIITGGGVGIAKSLYVGGGLTGTTGTFSSTLSATSFTGNLIGGTGSFSGITNVTNTTDSSSTTTGAIVTAGGAGIAKSLYVGGGLSGTTATFSGAVSTGLSSAISAGCHLIKSTSANDTLKIENSSTAGFASIWFSTPSIQGYFGIGGSSVVAPYQNNIYLSSNTGTNFVIQNTLTTIYLNTTDSSSVSTGAVQVNGGLGVAKNINVGGYISALGAISSTGNVISGAYVIGNHFASNMFAAPTGTSYSTLNLNSGNYGLLLSGGLTQSVGATLKLEVRNDVTYTPIFRVDAGTSNMLRFDQTADSSSSTSGAVIFDGGVGVAKSLYVGGNQVVTGSLTATTFNGVTLGNIPFTSGFYVSGATFVSPVDTSFYVKNGSVVTINVRYYVASSSGGSGNQILIYLPILPSAIQFSRLTMTSSLENPAANNSHIVGIYPGVGPSGIAYINNQDNSTFAITNGTYGLPSGSSRTYMLQFSYLV